MTDDYHTMRRRLWNWGCWARLDPTAPDGSCANPMYDFMIERDRGWGDDPPANIVRTQCGGVEPGEIQYEDAEIIDCLVRQIPQGHRALLVRVYVLQVGQGSRLEVDAAIRAIWDVQDANRAAIQELRKHGIG